VLCAARGALHLLGRSSEKEALLRGETVSVEQHALIYSAGKTLGGSHTSAAISSEVPSTSASGLAGSRHRVASPVYGRTIPAWMIVDDLARRFKVPLSLRFVLLSRVRAARQLTHPCAAMRRRHLRMQLLCTSCVLALNALLQEHKTSNI